MSKPVTVKEPAELLAFLFATWPEVKKGQIRSWLKFESVTVNGRPVTQFDHPLQRGDVVAIRAERAAAPKSVLTGGVKVVFEDEHLIVIEKPSNLLSIASEAEREKNAYFILTDYVRAKSAPAKARIWIVHRLDRETSGLMVFAKTRLIKEALQKNWDKAEKRYEAIVDGHLGGDFGTMRADLDETNPFRVRIAARASEETRHAVTHYRVLASDQRRSHVELTLETGRRHQIRVQLADAGCPIVGDEKYHPNTPRGQRLALHATFLRFPHPMTREELRFTSPLPRELAHLLDLRPAQSNRPNSPSTTRSETSPSSRITLSRAGRGGPR